MVPPPDGLGWELAAMGWSTSPGGFDPAVRAEVDVAGVVVVGSVVADVADVS